MDRTNEDKKKGMITIVLFGVIIMIITQLSLSVGAIATSTAALRIDSISAPSDIFVKFYDSGIPFDKVAQLIVNQTSLAHNNTPTQPEISLLEEIGNELKSGSYGAEFVSGTGNCDPASIKIDLETCDIHAAFIHEVCLQSTIGNDTLTCPANVISTPETYLHDRGITDPQTDALAYVVFTGVL